MLFLHFFSCDIKDEGYYEHMFVRTIDTIYIEKINTEQKQFFEISVVENIKKLILSFWIVLTSNVE